MGKLDCIENIANKVAKILPTGLQDATHEMKRNVKAVLNECFEKLDLVTREEFDVQCNVLARTRSKLEALEKSFNELAAQLPEKYRKHFQQVLNNTLQDK
ncbi:MAG: hypothetical protein COC15_02765 [Legionellales bacterium]|nr:MAG: hypothetical protein COC15_02765 [Legionellales bacterium]